VFLSQKWDETVTRVIITRRRSIHLSSTSRC